MTSKEMVQLIADACDEKQAENIVALDMNRVSLVADYFVICHANNERQVQAVARSVKETMDKHQIPINQLEGLEQARWVIIDTGDVLCHIFHKNERHYYNLERLWGDASTVPIELGKS